MKKIIKRTAGALILFLFFAALFIYTAVAVGLVGAIIHWIITIFIALIVIFAAYLLLSN